MTASCVECLCEDDLGCGTDERCDTETGKCIKVDGGVAYPVDGTVVSPDGSDGGPCTGPSDCDQETAPICDESNDQCRGCEDSTECVDQVPALPVCNTDSGACVECFDSEDDCGGTEPICDDTSFECRGCTGDSDCADHLPGLPACAPDHSCVGCVTSVDHCDGDTPFCDPSSSTCRACTAHMVEDSSGDWVTGTNNLSGTPNFTGDYHLQSGSPRINVADPNTTLTQDIDGDDRFQGTAPDMGADEVE